ncbi:sensor histidine kinase [Arthrobacter sp. zg-ZUI100]|uniref:histidine kinase n=1 Tax=Arthrobacter jiangjiafuii TaxID=2817475 RepID=A0A975R0T5_9MICC|nr:histidine kinase [Arthrobacter jiangjiafuii]MBP3035409.1 sensor histidine kinase [Arthrobacter jiangjiafuii]MBP3042391.1 sensor histidine kinase [Arthrobacter jiangjiafuii]QWC09858.1 sensor histidine kinase [Arthrobacter jiangjiafuii]
MLETAAPPADQLTRSSRFQDRIQQKVSDDWERPAPTREQLRRDVIGTAVVILIGAIALESSRGFGAMGGEDRPVWLQHLVLALMILPLALRRRFPVTVLLVSSALFLGLSMYMPALSVQVVFQGAYFAAIYAGVAWARNRRLLRLALLLVITGMALWLLLSFTVSNAYDSFMEDLFETQEDDPTARGLLPPMVSYAIYSALINAAYFGGAIIFGLTSWRSAHQREQLAHQAEQLKAQSAELAHQAVVNERLRIARELHDVVAHHIAVIGVHAGAARRVLVKKPETTATALQTIEESSRQAVEEMRSLLGVLRASDEGEPGTGDGGTHRRPEPGLAELDALVAEHRANGLQVSFSRIEDSPGALDSVSAPLALSIYRTVQESLANVRRHSTAGAAVVTLRTGTTGNVRWLEVETVDDGRPRPGSTSGSGFGLRGIRERAALHGGVAEIGPRAGGGWRVRVRFTQR